MYQHFSVCGLQGFSFVDNNEIIQTIIVWFFTSLVRKIKEKLRSFVCFLLPIYWGGRKTNCLKCINYETLDPAPAVREETAHRGALSSERVRLALCSTNPGFGSPLNGVCEFRAILRVFRVRAFVQLVHRHVLRRAKPPCLHGKDPFPASGLLIVKASSPCRLPAWPPCLCGIKMGEKLNMNS